MSDLSAREVNLRQAPAFGIVLLGLPFAFGEYVDTAATTSRCRFDVPGITSMTTCKFLWRRPRYVPPESARPKLNRIVYET
jgi:hypothetical protein